MKNPAEHLISLLVALCLCVLACGTALASPEGRVKRISSVLNDEGFSSSVRASATDRVLLVVVEKPGRAGFVSVLVRRFDSKSEAVSACVGGIKRGEELRVKGGGKQVARRRVRLKGASNVHLLRFKAQDESGSVANLVFACGSETVELNVIGQPTPKGLKRIASKVIQTLKQVSPEGAPFDGAAPSRGGAAQSIMPGRVLGTGTGFYVTPTEIVTNAHVVGDAKEVRLVGANQARFMGTVMARSTDCDLALIKVERRGRPLPLAMPRNLQNVFVYGYGSLGDLDALGDLPLLATEGRISGRHKGALITSAHINPGNSGGPLVDTSGRAVGVVFAKSKTKRQGVDSLGFVIPGDVAHKWLGAQGVRLRLDTSQASGNAPNDASVRAAVVQVERLAGR